MIEPGRRESNFRVDISTVTAVAPAKIEMSGSPEVRVQRSPGEIRSPIYLYGYFRSAPRRRRNCAIIAFARRAASSSNCARNAVCHLFEFLRSPAARVMLLFHCYTGILLRHTSFPLREISRVAFTSLPYLAFSPKMLIKRNKERLRVIAAAFSVGMHPTKDHSCGHKLGLARERLVNRLKLT